MTAIARQCVVAPAVKQGHGFIVAGIHDQTPRRMKRGRRRPRRALFNYAFIVAHRGIRGALKHANALDALNHLPISHLARNK